MGKLLSQMMQWTQTCLIVSHMILTMMIKSILAIWADDTNTSLQSLAVLNNLKKKFS